MGEAWGGYQIKSGGGLTPASGAAAIGAAAAYAIFTCRAGTSYTAHVLVISYWLSVDGHWCVDQFFLQFAVLRILFIWIEVSKNRILGFALRSM